MALAVSGLTIVILSLLLSLSSLYLQRKIRVYLISIFSVLILYMSSNLLGQAMTGHANLVLESRVLIFVESVSSSVAMLLLHGLLMTVTEINPVSSGNGFGTGSIPRVEKNFRDRLSYLLAGIAWLIYIGLLIYTQFSTSIYYFDPAGFYHRGPLYPLLLVPPVLIMLNNLATMFLRRENLTRRERNAFLIYFLAPMVTMLIQMMFYGIFVIVLGTAIASIVLYVNIQRDQMDIFLQQENEKSRLEMDILLAQIQPHFIYNSLGVIGTICETDARKAAEAIRDFTHFLGHNMDSLSTSDMIEFDREMDHVRCYVNLQKLRFGDALQVETDLQCRNFSLPTLTLQPLVENAITYGVRKNTGGVGTVRIRTVELEDRVEVIVSDNGPGFVKDTLPGDGRLAHIGLTNVRDRLQRVCGAELRIVSQPGAGTTATMILPKTVLFNQTRK